MRHAVLLTFLFVPMLVFAACRDEDLDDFGRASRIEVARAEAARLHAGVSFAVQTFR